MMCVERLKRERGAVITGVVIIGGIAVGIAALIANNYYWHGSISVACTVMGLPLGTC